MVLEAYPTSKAGGRPKSQVTEPPSPCHRFASMLSWEWPAGCQAGGTQNVKPEARTWCHTESRVPIPGTAQGTSATGTVCDDWPPRPYRAETKVRNARVC